MRRIWLALTLALWGAAAIPAHAAPVPIGGRIVDPDGRPVRGASVELGPVPDAFGWSELRLHGKILPEPVARAASRDDGRFEIAAPAPGMWQVIVAARGFVPRIYYLLPAFEATELPLLEMTRDVPLRVRVLGPQGKPVDGAR
ncbi:MAG TPA: carboxypeptidase-like regulatory domain-containing protein, partial [Thermoanaerobaculia bacterium]|nr:carboxypeptidase-like regulatory domain-containing protein [Thermoanaerobaculia bacterium]